MRKCFVLTCGASESDGRSKWIRMVNRDRSDISDSTVVCSRHFPEDLIGKEAKRSLKRGAFPTLQLQGAPTASTGRKRLRSRAEPEEILNTPMGESLHSEDCGGVSTIPPHLEDVDKICPVKEEQDEFAATLGMEDEGKTFKAFDSMSLLPVLLEGQRKDGSVHVIEVPDEILPTPTGGVFRSEDCNRVNCPQLDLEVHNNSCFVKQAKLNCTLPRHLQHNLVIIISSNE